MLRDLYATPPPEFVAARNELVKVLRRDKRRDDASALAALRRPGWDDWALNTVAGRDAASIAGFASAAADVREAQSAAIEGRDGPDVRAALKELRERSAELVGRAEAALAEVGRPASAGEITARLSQVATNDVAVAQLLVGILGSGDTAPKDLFGGLEPAARPATRSKAAPAKRAAVARARDATGGNDRAERADRLVREQRRAALADASRVQRAAVATRRRAAADADKAAATVEKARAALATAEDGLAAAQAELDTATSAAAAAEEALDAARSLVGDD